MIQRIQSLYLLIAAGVLGTSAVLVCTVSLLFLVLVATASLLSFITIFLYRNRKLQLRLITVVLLLNIVAPVIVCLQKGITFWQTYLFAGVLLILAFVFELMARAGVIYDEKLVRSANRLR